VTSGAAGLAISFNKKGDRIFANALCFQSPQVVDRRLGRVLEHEPVALERTIKNSYGSRYEVVSSYGSAPMLGCMATLRERTAPAGITFGINPYRPSRPFLQIRANAYG